MFANVTEMRDFAPVVSPVISPALDFSPVLNLGSTFGDFAPSLGLSGVGGV